MAIKYIELDELSPFIFEPAFTDKFEQLNCLDIGKPVIIGYRGNIYVVGIYISNSSYYSFSDRAICPSGGECFIKHTCTLLIENYVTKESATHTHMTFASSYSLESTVYEFKIMARQIIIRDNIKSTDFYK